MRRVNRETVVPPASLASSGELASVRAHRRSDPLPARPFEFKAYRNPDVKLRLEELFRGKCAYCETSYAANSPVDVEHFRPKGAPAEDPSHPGYWWLAMEWTNLLPSCIDCNRRREQLIMDDSASLSALWQSSHEARRRATELAGKGRSFPVAGTRARPEDRSLEGEGHLLLDPSRDDPSEHLDFKVVGRGAISLAVPVGGAGPSRRGAVTIQAFGLNRLALVQERTRVIRRLEFLHDLLLELDEVSRALSAPKLQGALRGTPAEPAGDLLRRAINRILKEMFSAADATEPHSAAAAAWLKGHLVQALDATGTKWPFNLAARSSR